MRRQSSGDSSDIYNGVVGVFITVHLDYCEGGDGVKCILHLMPIKVGLVT